MISQVKQKKGKDIRGVVSRQKRYSTLVMSTGNIAAGTFSLYGIT